MKEKWVPLDPFPEGGGADEATEVGRDELGPDAVPEVQAPDHAALQLGRQLRNPYAGRSLAQEITLG